MTKAQLRQKYLEERKALSQNDIKRLSELIFNQFIEYFKPKKGESLHIFKTISKFNEVETSYFIDYAWENKMEIYLPKMLGESLVNIAYTANTKMGRNSWGIDEPLEMINSEKNTFDYIITPLLYCDHNGNRVGYGKGFYDKLFSKASKSKKIGVSFFIPSESIDDLQPNDYPLDYLITPNEVLSFKGTKSKLIK